MAPTDESSSRSVPMKVLALGLSRSGTGTMQAVLEQLGYIRTFHGLDMVERPDKCRLWEEALDAKYLNKGKLYDRQGLDKILGDYMAVTDVPSTCFAEELVAAYPEAKVVLVERDYESWYKSFEKVVVRGLWDLPTTIIGYYVEPFLGRRSVIVSRKSMLGLFKAKTPDEILENAPTIFREYHARLREITPPERLLNYDLSSGWQPLCNFLGDEVPSTPFPQVNEADAMKEKVERIQGEIFVEGLRKLAVTLLPAGAVAVAAVYWYRRMR